MRTEGWEGGDEGVGESARKCARKCAAALSWHCRRERKRQSQQGEKRETRCGPKLSRSFFGGWMGGKERRQCGWAVQGSTMYSVRSTVRTGQGLEGRTRQGSLALSIFPLFFSCQVAMHFPDSSNPSLYAACLYAVCIPLALSYSS